MGWEKSHGKYYIYSWFRVFFFSHENVSSGNSRMPLLLHKTSLLKGREILRFCNRSVLYHQQSAQLQAHRWKGQMEPFILPELLHNTEHRISSTDSCIKPIISVWARQSFLYTLHLCFVSHCGIVSVLWMYLQRRAATMPCSICLQVVLLVLWGWR